MSGIDIRLRQFGRAEQASVAQSGEGTEPPSGKPLVAVGVPLMATGGVLLGVGLGLAARLGYSSYSALSYCPGPTYYTTTYCAGVFLPPIVAGAAMLGVGIPFTIVGAEKERARKDWRQAQISLTGIRVAVGPRAWTGELRFQF